MPTPYGRPQWAQNGPFTVDTLISRECRTSTVRRHRARYRFSSILSTSGTHLRAQRGRREHDNSSTSCSISFLVDPLDLGDLFEGAARTTKARQFVDIVLDILLVDPLDLGDPFVGAARTTRARQVRRSRARYPFSSILSDDASTTVSTVRTRWTRPG